MRPVVRGIARRCTGAVLFAAAGLTLTGCGTLSSSLRAERPQPPTLEAHAAIAPSQMTDLLATPEVATTVSAPADDRSVSAAGAAPAHNPLMMAQAGPPSDMGGPTEVEQYDPWEPFNEKMFDLNYRIDRYVLKPAANVYRHVIPEPFQVLIANGFDNIRWVPRFVNSALQAKWNGAGREAARFLINSTAGIGGLFDPAKDYWGIRASKEDFGQTLGVWGAGPGPYLVLPLLPPMTVRDGVGMGVDALMDPLSYFIPFIWDRLGMRVGDTLNERALNYELFQGVEETTIDLYSSVRHFYLQRRDRQIKE